MRHSPRATRPASRSQERPARARFWSSRAAEAGRSPVVELLGAAHPMVRVTGAIAVVDHRLRAHFATLADSTRHWHPWAKDVYTRARQRGCDHPHAIRIVGRAWARILWRCWQDQTPYDPTRHGNLNHLHKAGG